MLLKGAVNMKDCRALESAETVSTVIASGDTSSLRAYWLLFALISLLLCLPFWTTQYVPMVDLPNHLARAYILHHYDDVAAYQAMYDRVAEPLPNLAFDLVVPPLLYFFDIHVAGKIFLTLMLLLFSVGCHLLGTSIHGRPTWLALPSIFFIYNTMLIYGFVNYLFGLGMFLITLAVWLRWRKRWNLNTFVIVSLLAFACYVSHLSAYLFLGLALSTITFFDFIRAKSITKKMVMGLLPLLPPLAVFLTYVKSGGETKQVAWFVNYSVVAKLAHLSYMIQTYNRLWEIVIALVMLVIILITVLYARNWQIGLAILVTCCGLGLLFLVCPEGIFQTALADVRFVPPAAVLMLVALNFQVDKRIGKWALLLFLAVSLIRVGSIGYEWSKIDEKIAAQVAAFNRFEDGAKVYPLVSRPAGYDRKKYMVDRSFWHIIHYSTIDRHTFSSTLFAIKGQQPIRFKNNIEFTNPQTTKPVEGMEWEFIFGNYDYLWCYKINDKYMEYLKDNCQLVAETDDSMIFRVNRR